MKRILLTLTILSIWGCAERDQIKQEYADTESTSLITLTVHGKSHEFVKYSKGIVNNGISHWPECSFCSSKDSI